MYNENVLVFPAEVLDTIPPVHGYSTAAKNFAHQIFKDSSLSFLDRDIAEVSPEYKQIIPYVIFLNRTKTLCYTRSKVSGDSRLRTKSSIGFGGHINDGDGLSPYAAYQVGLQRELTEELDVIFDFSSVKMIGCIYDDSNEVGRCHFGVVYTAQAILPEITSSDPSILDLRWLSSEELIAEREGLENWSRLIVDSLRL